MNRVEQLAADIYASMYGIPPQAGVGPTAQATELAKALDQLGYVKAEREEQWGTAETLANGNVYVTQRLSRHRAEILVEVHPDHYTLVRRMHVHAVSDTPWEPVPAEAVQ